MNSQQTQSSNLIEENQNSPSILNLYISQRDEILNRMKSEKLNEENAKEFVNQKYKIFEEIIKMYHDLEKENESIKEMSEEKMELINSIGKILVSANELMTNNIENVDILQNLMQLSINDQQHAKEVKQSVLDYFQKFKCERESMEKEYLKKLTEKATIVANCKANHSKNEKYLDDKINKITQEIFTHKVNKIILQNEITTNVENNTVNKEINILKEENDNITKKFSDLQIMFNEFTHRKEMEEFRNNKKIIDLKSSLTNQNESLIKSKKEFEDLQSSIACRKEFFDQLNNKKESATKQLSNIKIIENENEIFSLENQLKEIREDYDNQINTLKKQYAELEENKLVFEEENTDLEKKLSEIENDETSFNFEINNIEISIKKSQQELKKDLELFEAQSLKIENEICALEKIIEEENQKQEAIEDEERKLEDALVKENEELKEINLRNDSVSAEAETEEIAINLEIDSIKKKINSEIFEINEKKKEIMICTSKTQEKREEIEKNCQDEIKNLNSKIKKTKIELTERNKIDEKLKTDELQKLKENKVTLEFQITEYTVSVQNLKDLLKLKENELVKLTHELNENIAEINKNSEKFPSPKKPGYDFIIPKTKIPPWKYNSTSDSSIEDIRLSKRRKVSFKNRRPEKKSVLTQKNIGQSSQKSTDIVDDLRATSDAKLTRKRSNKKPVF